jgi:hypothetical protein
MQRRHLLCTSLLLGSGVTAAQTAQTPLPRFTVPLELLQTEVAKRFPLRYPVAGLVNLDLAAPQLALLPDQNRMRAQMPVTAAGAALARSQQGSFTVDFALRYEHGDRSLRAHQLKVYRFRFPGLPPEAVDMLNTYAPTLAEQALREVVLYQLQPKESAMADLLGLQPGRISVTQQGLLVELANKPPS